MAHAAETLVDPLLVRQVLSWQSGTALPVASDVPTGVLRSAPVHAGNVAGGDRELWVQCDLTGWRRDRVRVGTHEQSLYIWEDEGAPGEEGEDLGRRAALRLEVGAPFLGEYASARMAYGVLTVRLPVQPSEQSGVYRAPVCSEVEG
jgi:hypothetical protein